MLFRALLLTACCALAQDQQSSSRPGWPCVAGRAVDPSYVEISESTGGHLFLAQKGEIEQTTPLLLASTTHPATIFRAVGSMAGTKQFDFPVDSTVSSLLFAISMQCRQSIALLDPQGAEMTPANTILSTELKTGKLVRVDAPGAGNWRIRVTGQGLYVLLVFAATDLRLGGLHSTEPALRLGAENSLPVSVSESGTDLRFALITPEGDRLPAPARAERDESGMRVIFTPPVERFRIMAEGLDPLGRPFRRVHPVLFRAGPGKN
jgi:hypothetical protein